MPVESEIREIKTGMLKHFHDDEKQFDNINKKLDTLHDNQIVNGEVIKQVLQQSLKTNGRVNNLEEMCVRLDKAIALLEKSNQNLCSIVSVQHNQYANFVSQQERLREKDEDEYVSVKDFEPIKKKFDLVQGIIITAVIGAILSLIIIK